MCSRASRSSRGRSFLLFSSDSGFWKAKNLRHGAVFCSETLTTYKKLVTNQKDFLRMQHINNENLFVRHINVRRSLEESEYHPRQNKNRQ